MNCESENLVKLYGEGEGESRGVAVPNTNQCTLRVPSWKVTVREKIRLFRCNSRVRRTGEPKTRRNFLAK